MRKILGPDSFIVEFHQISKEEWISALHKHSKKKKKEEEEPLLHSLCTAGITLTPITIYYRASQGR